MNFASASAAVAGMCLCVCLLRMACITHNHLARAAAVCRMDQTT